VDPLTLTFLLGRLGRLTDSMTTDICADAATTPAEIRVLAYLVHAPERTARPSDVARFAVQTSGGLTATLGRLESAGLIKRRPDPTDGRGKLIVLSGDGRRLHDAVITRLTAATAAAVGDLDLDDVGIHVRDLVIALERAAGLPTSAGFVANPLGVHA
jgi:DNA-binding MarR family transcriptional regulator